MQFDYFYGNEAGQFTFYRIPKILMTSPQFKGLSDSAKLLYGMMLDRMGLSLRNGWLDEQGRAYIFFTIDDIMEIMGCATGKVVKMLAELDTQKGVGLIERKKQGQGKPTIIYLKKFVGVDKPAENPAAAKEEKAEFAKSERQNFEKENSKTTKSEITELPETQCNNTEYNDTEFNNINLSNQSTEKTEERWIDRYTKNVKFLKENADYETLCYSHDKGLVDNCVNIMAEVLSVDVKYYTIEGHKYPSELVQLRIRGVNFSVLDSFLLHFEKKTSKVFNMKAYLITSLFNAPSTTAAQLHNTVAYDMYGRKGGEDYAG